MLTCLTLFYALLRCPLSLFAGVCVHWRELHSAALEGSTGVPCDAEGDLTGAPRLPLHLLLADPVPLILRPGPATRIHSSWICAIRPLCPSSRRRFQLDARPARGAAFA